MLALRHGRTRRLALDAHPHTVAAEAARVARRFASDIRNRPVMLAALGPYLERQDFTGATLAAALGAWARDVAWVREPADLGELIVSPWRTAAMMAGDCDDVAAAVAAFAALAGMPSATAVYSTGPHGAHVGAVLGADSFRGPWSYWVDQSGTVPWPSPTLHPRDAARLFIVRRP